MLVTVIVSDKHTVFLPSNVVVATDGIRMG